MSVSAFFALMSVVISIVFATVGISEAEREKANLEKAIREGKDASSVISRITEKISKSKNLSNQQLSKLNELQGQLTTKLYAYNGPLKSQLIKLSSAVNKASHQVEQRIGAGNSLELGANYQANALSSLTGNQLVDEDPNSATSVITKNAEEMGNQASKQYEEANKIGEKYV